MNPLLAEAKQKTDALIANHRWLHSHAEVGFDLKNTVAFVENKLKEMGYTVNSLSLYSSKDNRKYEIAIPGKAETASFEAVLKRIRTYNPEKDYSLPDLAKCRHCNYKEICSFFPEEERS